MSKIQFYDKEVFPFSVWVVTFLEQMKRLVGINLYSAISAAIETRRENLKLYSLHIHDGVNWSALVKGVQRKP